MADAIYVTGLRVFATARSRESIADLNSLGIETLSLEVDKPDSVRECRDNIEELTGGSLNYLVNNAGRRIGVADYTVPALDIDFDEVQQTFEVNLFAVMRMCQTFSPLLIKSKGTIVQIGSLAAIMPHVFGSVYNATKAALHAYSNTLRIELAPFGVSVITIVTGGVQSRIARTERSLPEGSYYETIREEYDRRQKHSQEGAMKNEDYARSVVGKVLGGGRKWVWEGNKSWVVWFLDSFAPRGIWDIVFRRMFKLWKLGGVASTSKKAV
ncbi:MAG: hypothetical protein M1830_005052 [Pleopsidium flavum]|nr:MAG: hypothetical protein M1830_005052 [Pleopsidium flavum]